MKITPQEIKVFQKKILGWYKKNKRDLPWRHLSSRLAGLPNGLRDPYTILVSEVMSQQTQLSRVVPKYNEWMKVFPDVYSLAKASTRDVLAHWSGLGYNRRALYLKKVAELLSKEPKGTKEPKVPKVVWPRTEEELRELPGIGEYTARALLCFAFHEQVAVVDTNVRKVILTQFQTSNFKSQISKKEIQEIADKLLPKGKAYEWNQALMDYAALLRPVKLDYGRVRQSVFKDSDRYYRGQILKLLIAKKKSSQEILFRKFKDIPTMNKERFEKILQTMVKDTLIKQQGSSFLV